MTNDWVDIKNADVILVMGGNPAEAHPCGFKWVVEAKAKKKARLVVVDPRFTRTAALADLYAPIRPGTDIAFLGGVIHYLLGNGKIQEEYVKAYTNASFLVNEGFGFEDGLFSGYAPESRKYDKSTWTYQLDQEGYVKTDPTLSDPNCVLQRMKKHYERYTPELVERVCGTPREKFLKVCELIATTATPDRTMTSLYALGWTQHSVGSQNVRSIAVLQLLLGNMGMSGGGVNALRGHSNIQGLTDLGLLSTSLPGYLTLPDDDDETLKAYLAKRTTKPLRPGQLSYWSNYPKFMVSLLKSWYGGAATAQNDFAYAYLPKVDTSYDVLRVVELMNQGKMNGYICQGFNALASFPDKGKVAAGLAKLRYLVVIDPLATETSEFWQNYGEHNDVDPAKIETEVFRLPSTCFAEEDGSLVNSSRWLQWHWKAADPPGEAKGDAEIVGELFLRLRQAYARDGGAFPDPILRTTWNYRVQSAPSAEELAREYNGQALADVPDPKKPGALLAKAGEQLPGFAVLQSDGTTACGCWIFAGCFTEAGNQMARRDTADPSALGVYSAWAWSWPANRRILYNRASCDPSGAPYIPSRKLVWWNGHKWVGNDVPDFKVDSAPDEGMNPFIMNAEGVARLWAPAMAEGPFPEHYEPFDSPLAKNPFGKVLNNPAARVFPGDQKAFGKPDEFPCVATTYRLTEHFHFWTKHARIPSVLQPEAFVELGEGLAKKKGIQSGDLVVVRSKRGVVKLKALVTRRLPTLVVEGKEVDVVGLPIHWGFTGQTKKGYLTNTLTPPVGDANIQTPEYKAFLVSVERA